ncbi:MAG: response regulator transcription factor [Chthoniobacterales bacterium]
MSLEPITIPKKRILVVDDHPMMREGLGNLIGNQPDLEVCGEAESAAQALDLIATSQPDVVLADITLPGKSGLELVKDIAVMHPHIATLVVSMHDESVYAERVLRAGGRGYVMKKEGGKRILAAIRKVLAGEIAVSEQMSAKILQIFSGRRDDAPHSPIEQLTDREFEVFQLLGSGESTSAIAAKLHLSAKTVEVHRVHIKDKLGIRTAPELTSYAARWTASQNAGG